MEPKMFNLTMSEEVIYLILEGLGKLSYERVEGLISGIRETLAKPAPEETKAETPLDLPAIVPEPSKKGQGAA
jgi:hypothetical protein